jgi:large subunit ribosomal protein L30
MKKKQPPKASGKEKMIKVQWKRSASGHPENQRKTIQGLGFRRLHQIRILPDRPAIRGMILRVSHLVDVLES